MAGHMSLGKLVVLYDSNDISLDGELRPFVLREREQTFRRLTAGKYLRVEDGNDLDALAKAIAAGTSRNAASRH